MGNCDFGNCNNSATTKGFVVLRGLDKEGKVRTQDVNACDKHKNKNGFISYHEESENEE
jgi:hypothetical protein